ncbi:MAG: hypothetical protein DRJ38_06545 [Thermoprotei archaeon]|nr:MAG: hypothetical protein DRJ38_06545 [Thermoprotei archaeon]
MEGGPRDELGEMLEKTEKLREFLKGKEEAEKIIEEIEDFLKNPERVVVASVKKISKEKSKEEIVQIVDKMRKDEQTGRFMEVARHPWGGNKTLQLLMQGLWVITAAISFMMGVYLFFPPYVFFGKIHGNATATIQKTLELISKNPQVLAAIDPLFKIIGFVMMAIAIASLYQAHIISTFLKEE